ncbi:hypothetical protein [Haloplanus aerogenes]|uniref:Uncharacterized protein n=1 Tax=Haloplanus aerogenes TaxID=660522 RepID=A0A3M0CMK1_9EURY|nr:hypothetical protein [Haloplanus aerogenes]RMB08249.1 hypothetical protein ATH50_3665 [Haloplanus aerogenes]
MRRKGMELPIRTVALIMLAIMVVVAVYIGEPNQYPEDAYETLDDFL